MEEAEMAIAMLIDNPEGSQEMYDKVLEHLALDGKPAGGILHVAGPSPNGGWRVVEVWESKEAAQRFVVEQLNPALEAAGSAGQPEPEFWPVHNHMI
jgi:hypothetical protein